MNSYVEDILDYIQKECEAHPELNNRLSIKFSSDLKEKRKVIDALEELENRGFISIYAKAIGIFGVVLL